MASRSYGAARSVSDHLAVVATVTPGPCGSSFLSVTHRTLGGKVVRRRDALAGEARDRHLGVVRRANRRQMSSAWLLVCAATAIRMPSAASADEHLDQGVASCPIPAAP